MTGGAGLIGAYTVQKLVDKGENVVIYDLYAPEDPGDIEILKCVKDRVVIEKGDVLDLPYMWRIARKYEARGIIHLAAVRQSTREMDLNPAKGFRVNCESVVNILEMARSEDSIRRIVFASSGHVFGNGVYEPVDEDHPKRPNDFYGITKLFGELYGLKYHEMYGIDFIVARVAPVYGPRRNPPSLIMNFVENALTGMPTKLAEGGDHRSEYTYVEDIASGLALAYLAEDLEHRVFNIGTGRAYTLFEVRDLVRGIFPEAEIRLGPGPIRGVDVRGPFNIDRAREELNYEPKYDLRRGLQEYVKYLNERRSTGND